MRPNRRSIAISKHIAVRDIARPSQNDLKILRECGVATVVVCGLATNICCYHAARDLRRACFRVLLVEDASAGIDVPAANLFQSEAKSEGTRLGIEYVTTDTVLAAAR